MTVPVFCRLRPEVVRWISTGCTDSKGEVMKESVTGAAEQGGVKWPKLKNMTYILSSRRHDED